MRDDEFQILGASKKRSKWIFWAAAAACLLLLTIMACLFFSISKRHAQDGIVNKSERTTIIPELQTHADSVLRQTLKQIGGDQGQVIVMEVETGEIKAMVGLERRFDGRFMACENFGFQQEPGSTMKTAALLALLETGKVELKDEVDTENGIWEIDGNYIKDHNWRRGGYGMITMERALEISSNIGISKKILQVFKGQEQSYYQLLDKMCLGQPEQMDELPCLKPEVFYKPDNSNEACRQMLWNAIGYERLMAPIQTLTFYNAIANNGKMMKPTLTAGKHEVINNQIASQKSIANIQMALYHVVNDGLGKKAAVKGLAVAGKTGTAEVATPYEDENIKGYHLSFCGYFPASQPKYSMIVSLNKLGLPASGGGMAGHVFSSVAEWMLKNGMTEKKQD